MMFYLLALVNFGEVYLFVYQHIAVRFTVLVNVRMIKLFAGTIQIIVLLLIHMVFILM
jgi:hypothetical protein